VDFVQIIAVVAIVAGALVFGGGIWLGLALLSPELSRRVFGADAPVRFSEPRQRQAAYIKESSLALYLLISGPMALFYGLTMLQQLPFAVLETVFWPLLALGLCCALVRRSMARRLRQQ
jgi:Flp pilus assembly protein TadB